MSVTIERVPYRDDRNPIEIMIDNFSYSGFLVSAVWSSPEIGLLFSMCILMHTVDPRTMGDARAHIGLPCGAAEEVPKVHQ